ncbi:hypothetical protein [Lederbergia galactosidilytica]|nr:hypothetical protein [Lederbergia galactosidilytica]MBP1913295.1 hypothetical protein [Lederbergia galactosidilytica]
MIRSKDEQSTIAQEEIYVDFAGGRLVERHVLLPKPTLEHHVH